MRPRSSAASFDPIFKFVMMALVIVIVTAISLFFVDSIFLGVTIGTSVVLCILPYVVYRWNPVPFAPVYWTVTYLLFAYPIKLLAVRAQLDYVGEDYLGVLWDDTLVAKGLWTFSLGLIAYFLGYYKPPDLIIRNLARIRIPRADIHSGWPIRILIVSGIGWGVLAFQILTGQWSSFAGLGENWSPVSNQLLSYLSNYMWLGLIGAMIWLISKEKEWTTVNTVLSIGVIVVTISSSVLMLGSKTWLSYPFVWFLAAFYMQRKKLPIGLSAFVLGVGLIFAYTFVPQYRSTYMSTFGKGQSGAVGDYLVTARGAFDGMSATGVDLSQSIGAFISRFGGIDNALRVMDMVPQSVDYFYFKEFLNLPFTIIPRALLPGKPTSNMGAFYTAEVAGMIGGSAAAHPVAEGYLNLGIPGVAILFWIWGVSQAAWFKGFYEPRKGEPIVQLIYTFYMMQSVGFGNWVIASLLGLPGQFILLIPLIYILSSSKKVQKVRPSFAVPSRPVQA